MRCPNCSNEVPLGPTCPRCLAPLEVPPLSPAGSAGPGSVPLTSLQKARLVVDCLPLLFFVAALAFSVMFLPVIVGALVPKPLLVFLGLVILLVGWTAVQRIRDLSSGVALVQDDLLERLYGSRQGGRHRWGRFAQLGRLGLTPKAYHQGQPGRRHRIIYSPASKIVWSLEPLS